MTRYLWLIHPNGKTISVATHGSISCKKSFAGGFVGDLNLEGLEANKTYRLTLSRDTDLAGNDLLRSYSTATIFRSR